MLFRSEELPRERVLCLSYEELQMQTEESLKVVCDFCSLPFGENMQTALSQAKTHFESDDFAALSQNAKSQVW